MKFTLFTAFVLSINANIASAQDQDRPSPQPGLSLAGGAPGLSGNGGLGVMPTVPGAPPVNPAIGGGGFPGIGGGRFPDAGGGPAGGGGIPGGFPGGVLPGVGGMPGGAGGFGGGGGGFGGMPPMGVGGMPSGGMGMPGMGFGDISNRFQLFTGEVVPEGKDKPLPMILKIDTQTGQVWRLQAGAQNKVRFVLIDGQPRQFNGPPTGFGGGGPALGIPGGGLRSVPVDPTTGLPLNGRPGVAPGPQTPPNPPTGRPEF